MTARRSTIEAAAGALSDYYEWFKDAKIGDVLVYYRGDLTYDRDVDNFRSRSGFKTLEPRIIAIDGMAKRIFADAKEGFLSLTQKKVGPSMWDYRACRITTARDLANQMVNGNGNGRRAFA